jgi:hypothetical protein
MAICPHGEQRRECVALGPRVDLIAAIPSRDAAADAVRAFEPRSKRPCRNRGHVVDRVEKQRTNYRLLADQRHGGVSLRNPLECLAANRLADHIFRNAELPNQVYYSSPLRSRIPGRFPDRIRD